MGMGLRRLRHNLACKLTVRRNVRRLRKIREDALKVRTCDAGAYIAAVMNNDKNDAMYGPEF
jgi:hypothetical protein